MFYDGLEKTIPGDRLAGRTAARRCRILCDHRGRGPQRFLIVWYGQGVKGSGEKGRRIQFGVEHIADAWFVWVLCQHSWMHSNSVIRGCKGCFSLFSRYFSRSGILQRVFFGGIQLQDVQGKSYFQESIWSDDSDGPNQKNTPGASKARLCDPTGLESPLLPTRIHDVTGWSYGRDPTSVFQIEA